MIVINLRGGLGNQMFQYAFARYLSIINNAELKLDISSFENYEWHTYGLNAFHISENILSHSEKNNFLKTNDSFLKRKFKNIFFRNIEVVEKNIMYNEKYKILKDPLYLTGYWQSEYYFKDIEDIIRNDFSFKFEPSHKNFTYLENIKNENSVSLHIRRGNYENDPNVNKVHGTISMNYYENAIELITSKILDPIFYIFSDDINWSKNYLKIKYPTNFIDFNDLDYEDLRLMSNCKHHIIANSSFSWWAAWLNPSRNKIVISPKIWFKDEYLNSLTSNLIPKEWYRI